MFPFSKHLNTRGVKGEGVFRQNHLGGGELPQVDSMEFSCVMILTRGSVIYRLKDKAKIVGLDDPGLGR